LFSTGTGLVLAALLAAQEPAPKPPPKPPPVARDVAGEAQRARVVQRHGITWHFDRDYVVGQFANGDPWVLGPAQIVRIEPGSTTVGDRVVNGSMIDPDPAVMRQGYDSALFGDEKRERYADELNVGSGVSDKRPLLLAPPCSLISVQSRADAKTVPQLQTAAVLTCLVTAPAPDAFRPSYVRGDKSIEYREANLDYSVLRRVRPAPDAPPIEVVALGFERLWLDHFPGWPVRYSHPLDNMPDYGRDISALVGSGALLLQFDLPREKKRDLFVRMVQLGIDHHAALRGGCRWQGIGGHGSGRKFPILLAGLALHDEKMLAIGRDFVSKVRGGSEIGAYFAEDGQTFVVEETAPGVINYGHGGYTKDQVGLPEWGFSHADHPDGDSVGWESNSYRRCCSANAWVGTALAARMMGLIEAWAHPPFFAYMDRYMQATHSEGWHRAWVPWHAKMWDLYRSNY
jgi:hypothetical protein